MNAILAETSVETWKPNLSSVARSLVSELSEASTCPFTEAVCVDAPKNMQIVIVAFHLFATVIIPNLFFTVPDYTQSRL